jgi:GT2 family glycosyltransferase
MDHLRAQADRLAADAGIRQWIVVANGNAALVAGALEGHVMVPRIIAIDTNAGSAIGFGQGIRAAVADPRNRFVLLLDEDNLPAVRLAENLRALFAAQTAAGTLEDGLALAAYRKWAHGAQSLGIDTRPRDSFLGFHLGDLPAKLGRRRRGAEPTAARVSIRSTAYGGMFFHRRLIEVIGLPRQDLVLYADDTEFSLRIGQAGGHILLATDLEIEDLDAPTPEAHWFSIAHWLTPRADFRLYYGARNEAWLDRNLLMRHRALYWLNRASVRFILRRYARSPAQRRQLALLEAAVAEGEAGRLGLNSRYPLPRVDR